MKKYFILPIILLTLLTLSFSTSNATIRNATICYSSSTPNVGDFIGRNFDLTINPSGQLYNNIKSVGSDIKILRYTKISTLVDGEPTTFEVHANNYVCINDIAPAGGECTGTTCTNVGQELRVCCWNMERRIPDFTDPNCWEYVTEKYFNVIGNDDGVMEDEAVFYYHPVWNYYATMACFPFSPSKWSTGSASDCDDWAGFSHSEIRDSLKYIKQNVWLPALMDTLRSRGKLRLANPAAYGVFGSDVVEDVGLTGTGLLVGEGWYLTPKTPNWNTDYWDVVDYVCSTEHGYAVCWNLIYQSDSIALGSWDRCLMERLSNYYMVGHPEKTWLMITGNESWLDANNWKTPSDSLYKWCPAFDYEIGNPTSDRYVVDSGVDDAGQSYTLYRRDFEGGNVVLYRLSRGGQYGDNTAIAYSFDGEEYKKLNADGTLSTPNTSFAIRNAEGVILIKNEPSPPTYTTSIEVTEPRYAPLDDMHYIGMVSNNTDDAVTVNIWVDILVGEIYCPIHRFNGITIPPQTTLEGEYVYDIPTTVKNGRYWITSRIFIGEEQICEDSYEFSIVNNFLWSPNCR